MKRLRSLLLVRVVIGGQEVVNLPFQHGLPTLVVERHVLPDVAGAPVVRCVLRGLLKYV